MRFFMYFISITATISLVLQSCNKDKVMQSTNISSFCTDTISFSTQVEPLIQMNCSVTNCHDATTAAFGYDLTGYSNITLYANNILNTMQHKAGYIAMPLGGSMMADTVVQKVDCWIQQGKLNN